MFGRGVCLVIAFAVAAAGCGSAGSSAGSPDMTLSEHAPTDHSPLWTVRDLAGTRPAVQSAPEVWTVVWPNDPYATRIADFTSWMLASDYWTGALAEYHVGAGTSKGIITLPSPAPAKMTSDDLSALAGSLVSSGQIANDANTNIVFYVPPTTSVLYAGGESCVVFAGFHSNTIGTSPIVFSVVYECDDGLGNVFDEMTEVTSHEVAEAATDPVGYLGYHGIEGNSEIGDLCAFSQELSVDAPATATVPAQRYWVQRFYSFATAAKGDSDPCLPVPYPRPFFGVTTNPAILPLHLVTGQAGVSLTTVLEPFAYGDVGEMHWAVIGGDFDVEPAGGTVHAGDRLELTIAVPSSASAVSHEIDLQVESATGGSNTWPFYVDITR
jgi:hypothetical protein